MDANKLKPGHIILIDDQPFRVVEASRRQQPRMAAKMITKLSNVISGAIVEKTFTASENVKEADVSRIHAQYIYNDGSNYVFMDMRNYEQFEIPKEVLGQKTDYLKEEMEVTVVLFNDKPIDLELPLSVTLEIQHTEPAVKGDSVTNIMKSATLETGAVVSVPLFIDSGEKIIINTESGEYRGRAK